MTVDLTVKGPGVIARLERPALRRWSEAADTRRSPLHLDVRWPDDAHAGQTGVSRCWSKTETRTRSLWRFGSPLPPGVHLAERTADVREIQGVLQITKKVEASASPTPLLVPVRFEFSGTFTVPEAELRVKYTDVPRTLAPARGLSIE